MIVGGDLSAHLHLGMKHYQICIQKKQNQPNKQKNPPVNLLSKTQFLLKGDTVL